jgi:hypothetical protein
MKSGGGLSMRGMEGGGVTMGGVMGMEGGNFFKGKLG